VLVILLFVVLSYGLTEKKLLVMNIV